MKILTRPLLLLLSFASGPTPGTTVNLQETVGPHQIKDLSDGTKEMVKLLKSISLSVNGAGSQAGGPSKEVLGFQKQLEGATKPALIAGLQEMLGKAFLRNGNVDEAIEQFDKIQSFLGRIKVAPHYAKLTLADALATGYLRKAENDNCLALHNPDSCLMPLTGGGVHSDKAGALQAQQYVLEWLELEPESRAARWLLNLVHMALSDYPDGVPAQYLIDPSIFGSVTPSKRHRNIATRLGIDTLGMAGGVVMDDLDNDGFVDLLTSAWGLEEQLVLLHNNGDGSFEDRTIQAGLAGLTGGLNICHADYDNDGDVDVLILRGAWKSFPLGHPNSLLRNNGDGTFSDVSVAAGVFSRHPTQVGHWADFDNDGWLDLFIGNESVNGAKHPCELYRNNQDGTFTDVAAQVGLDLMGFVKGASWGDYDSDGQVDLYVSRFGEPNQLFRNQGPDASPRFLDVALTLGVDQPTRSFPTWFFDFNNDGFLDLFVAPFPGFHVDSLDGIARDYLGEPHDLPLPRLYQGLAQGGFKEVSKSMGIDDAMLAMGANYGDLENDGYLDIYVGTGEPKLHTLVPNRMYSNAAGEGFRNVTFSGGFGHLQKGHGIAFGDLDNDGDQDIYAVMGGAYPGDSAYNACFENPGSNNAWVKLELQGTRANRSAIGAIIRVDVEAGEATRSIYRSVGTGGSFGSSTLCQEIGLGQALSIKSVSVRWPGTTNYVSVTGISPGASYAIVQDQPAATKLERTQFKLTD